MLVNGNHIKLSGSIFFKFVKICFIVMLLLFLSETFSVFHILSHYFSEPKLYPDRQAFRLEPSKFTVSNHHLEIELTLCFFLSCMHTPLKQLQIVFVILRRGKVAERFRYVRKFGIKQRFQTFLQGFRTSSRIFHSKF